MYYNVHNDAVNFLGELSMNEKKKPGDIKKVDTKEFELPETLFIRDIDNKVFQGIVLQNA